MHLKYLHLGSLSKIVNGRCHYFFFPIFCACRWFSLLTIYCIYYCFSNAFLEQKGFPAPKATKTGTTIVGIIYADGVILGADTRATENTVVSDKNCQKIHYLAGNMYCCGAGTAADTEMTTQSVASQLELLRLHTGKIRTMVKLLL